MSDVTTPKSDEVELLAKGLTWEEMIPGTAFRTEARTITESDLMTFVQWGGFNEPLFLDASHAEERGYAGQLVPGAMVYCIAEGLLIQTNVINGTAIAFLEMELKVKGPTFVGDTVHAIVETTATRATSAGDRGIVEQRITVRNQKGEDVLVFTPKRMIRGKGTASS